MKVTIPFGNETKLLELPLQADQIMVAQSKNPRTDRRWSEVVGEVLRDPIGAPPINAQRLAGKRVVIITDDWARPTPAWQVIPLLLRELQSTGVRDAEITFITASGMHDPIDRDGLARKLGEDIVARFRCVSHDAGVRESLVFCGVGGTGIPIWISRHVAEADYRIALGRIYLHQAYGYEGGYKMIVPGVAGFDTIARHHALDFSPDCTPGIHDNPARREADSIGRQIGIDFLINVVVNSASEPMKAFCGEPMEVHRRGVAWGDREVWGAMVPQLADITVVSPGGGELPKASYDPEVLQRAARITREDGRVICVTAQDATFDYHEGGEAVGESLCDLPREQFNRALPGLALGELVSIHDKRDWRVSDREVQWRIKAVRGEFYYRMKMRQIMMRRPILTADPNAALQQALAERAHSASPPEERPAGVAILPEGRTTLAKVG